ncbi:hypothetical protein ACFQAT_14890 [Undibacterium arcticum]|uniref:hypothetical protein n=1 Tax=Undibacterium arcticum TaxID=1762892 RepID=UPI003611C78E
MLKKMFIYMRNMPSTLWSIWAQAALERVGGCHAINPERIVEGFFHRSNPDFPNCLKNPGIQWKMASSYGLRTRNEIMNVKDSNGTI